MCYLVYPSPAPPHLRLLTCTCSSPAPNPLICPSSPPHPRTDQQPVTEASYANIPIVAFCNVDSPTKFIDVAVPCNNKSPNSIGLMWWFLAR